MKLLQNIKKIYSTSILHKIVRKISAAYHTSCIFSLNTAGDLDDALGGSALVKNTDANQPISSGVILPAFYNLANRMMHISLGEVSLVFLSFALAHTLSSTLNHDLWNALIFGIISIIMLPLCFVLTSVRSIIANCFIGRFFRFDFSAPAQKQSKWLIILLCVLAIVGGAFLPLSYAYLLPLIPVAFILLFYVKPLFFISAIMICLPIFGTSVCMVLSILLFLSQWLQRAQGTVQKKKIDYLDILLCVFIVLCILASLLSFAVGDSLRITLMWVTLFSVVFIIYRNVTTKKDLMVALVSLFIGALIACGVGLWQYLSGQVDTTWTDTKLFEDLSIRIYGTFANPNVFGEFLLLVVPFSVGLGLYFSKWKYKVPCFVISVISIITLALTYSRGCYIGIAVTAVIFLWMYNKKILGALLVVGTPVGIAMLPQNMLDRIASMVNFSDSSTSYRLKIYEGTFNMLGKFWSSGVGIGEESFNFVYPYFGVSGIVAPHSHSLFLQLFVSFGIAGFIYFALIMFIYHRNIISLLRCTDKNDKNKLLLITFGSVFFGFLVQSIFDYTWYNYRVYMLFWIIFGLGLATFKIIKRERGAL